MIDVMSRLVLIACVAWTAAAHAAGASPPAAAPALPSNALPSNALPSNAWSRASDPSSGPSRAIGFYSHGCLAGGVELPPDGPGYQVIRLSRHRNFGTADLVDFIGALAVRARAAGLPPLLVGDMAQPRGGPLPYGHLSHQIGLDVDLWFTFGNDPPPPLDAREQPDLPSMLTHSRRAVDPARFTDRQVALLRLAAADARVDRVFVNPAIKRALCAGYDGARQGGGAWLHKISPWWGHDDHFHVRLKCPDGSSECQPQQPVPAGDGCDATLAWWDNPVPAPVPAEPHPVPKVARRGFPAACTAILKSP